MLKDTVARRGEMLNDTVTRRSARQRRRLRWRAVDVRHGAANGDVWRSPGSVVIMYARSEGGARSVGFGRGRRSGEQMRNLVLVILVYYTIFFDIVCKSDGLFTVA